MTKDLARLIAKRNECKNKGDKEGLEKVRKEIKKLKISNKEIEEKKEKPKIKIKFSKDDSIIKNKKRKKTNKENKEKNDFISKKKHKHKEKIRKEKPKTIHKEKQEKKKVIQEEVILKNEHQLTKQQEKTLHQFYSKTIDLCNVDDFITVFKYYVENKLLDYKDLIYYINYYKDNFISQKNNLITQDFVKYVKTISKNIEKDYKNELKKICTTINDFDVVNNKKEQEIKNSPIYEILLYFIKNNNHIATYEIIDKYPDITLINYNNKNIIINVLELMLNNYNYILNNEKSVENIIDFTENIFIKLYNMNKSKEKEIELIFIEYINKLRQIKTTTVARNMVLTRINKVKEKLGLNLNKEYCEGEYQYLENYYQEELKNSQRKKIFDEVIILDELNNVSYSMYKINDYINLKINIVDLTTYFKDGTLLEQLLMNETIDLSKIRKYTKYIIGHEVPSITFEFSFNKNILINSSIYSSNVKTTNNSTIKEKYINYLNDLNIYSIRNDFNDLIKMSIELNSNNNPYIVSYKNEDDNYKIITDLNYIFGKLNKEEIKIIYEILNNSETKYGLSSDIKNKYCYDVNIFYDELKYINIIMQKTIKSFYDNNYKYDKKTIDNYVNQENKVLTKHI